MEVAPSSDPVVVSRENEGMQTYHERAQRNISEREKSSYATPPGYQAVGERQQDTREHERAPQATPSGYQPVEDPDDSPKRLCGLRQVTFWLTSALVLVTVSLIAVGAGLGTYWPNYLHQVERYAKRAATSIDMSLVMSASADFSCDVQWPTDKYDHDRDYCNDVTNHCHNDRRSAPQLHGGSTYIRIHRRSRLPGSRPEDLYHRSQPDLRTIVLPRPPGRRLRHYSRLLLRGLY